MKCPFCNEVTARNFSPKEVAEAQVMMEEFKEAVEVEKQKLRNKRPWFPWRISIVRK